MTEKSPRSIIQGGIIAAGQGTRLRADGYLVSKPMVPVAGRPLIELSLDRFRAVGIRRLGIIINETSDDCRDWLREHAGDFDLDNVIGLHGEGVGRNDAGARQQDSAVGKGLAAEQVFGEIGEAAFNLADGGLA